MTPRYIDFAYPAHLAAPHHFFISEASIRTTYLIECHGAAGGGRIVRASLGGDVFKRIRSDIRDALNARIKGVNSSTAMKAGEKKIPSGKGWNKGETTRLDRILGRELCVLFWALDGCPAGRESAVIDLWRSYRPEDLWWMFIHADQDGREHDVELKGWRKALPVIFQKDV